MWPGTVNEARQMCSSRPSPSFVLVCSSARLQRPAWEARWRDEESARADTLSMGTQSEVHSAYAG